MKYKKYIAVFLALMSLGAGLAFAMPHHALAADTSSGDQYGLGTTADQAYGKGANSDIKVIIGNVIKGALQLVGTIFLILLIYAGYLWMIARGNEEKVSRALDTIKAAVIGLIIVGAAYAIASYVITAFAATSTPAAGAGGAAGACGGQTCASGQTCTPNTSNGTWSCQ
jgi:hypothetical protein